MRKRSGRPGRFTMVANEAIDDPRLDMTALGVHAFVTRCKDGYEIDMDTLAKRRGPGRRVLYAAMRTLVDCGYVVKIKFQNVRGRWETEVFTFDTPATHDEVADILEQEFSHVRSVRVEPEWIAPQPPAGTEPPADEAPIPQPAPEVEKPQVTPTDRNRQAGNNKADSPACHNRQVGNRQAGSRQAKYKKTEKKTDTNTIPSVPPSLPDGWGVSQTPLDAYTREDGTDGRTDGNASLTTPIPQQAGSKKINTTPGVELLLSVGAKNPRYLISGKPLTDQGTMVTGLLEAGWRAEQIEHALTSRPLPDNITASVGAIIGRRLKDLACLPTPNAAAATAAAKAPRKMTREEMKAACDACDQYGFLPNDTPCRHGQVPTPSAF